jgi:hypothetical protein
VAPKKLRRKQSRKELLKRVRLPNR